MCSSSSVSHEIYTFRFNTLFVNCQRTGEGSFLNITECLDRDMVSFSPHTGSIKATHRTYNGSGVILVDRCPFTMQRSDHVMTGSKLLTLRPKMSHTCSVGARSGLLAGRGSVTMFFFVRKSLDKRAAVFE